MKGVQLDVLQLAMHPLFFNREKFVTRPYVDPARRITLHDGGPYILMEIHAEHIECYSDVSLAISGALIQLYRLGYLWFPNASSPLEFSTWVVTNYYLLISHVVGVEFAFDFPSQAVSLLADSEVPGRRRYLNTIYSKDYRGKRRKSLVSVYNRSLRLREQYKGQAYIEVDGKLYNQIIRVEYRLKRTSCGFLGLGNFEGTVSEIFQAYMPFIAAAHNRHFPPGIDIESGWVPAFDQLMSCASLGTSRYRGGLLRNDPAKKRWTNIRIRESVRRYAEEKVRHTSP